MKKKLLFVALVALFGSQALLAAPRAIGGRLGLGAEFSYQHGLNSGNMLSVDAGLAGFDGIEAAITHDWIFNISAWDKQGSWNWYLGVGAGGGFANLLNNNPNTGFIGVAGRVGAEYNFWFPLQLSLDWRPIIGPGFNSNGTHFYTYGLYNGGLCLGVRYLFH